MAKYARAREALAAARRFFGNVKLIHTTETERML